jgi:hypothetical protein
MRRRQDPVIQKKDKGPRRTGGDAKCSGKQHLGADRASGEHHHPMPSNGSSANSLRIFVCKLPQQTTEAELRRQFSGCGTVTKVDPILRRGKRNSGSFKRAAFVHFESVACAASALALDGQEIKGKAASVQLAEADGAMAKTAAATAPAGETRPSAVDPPAGISSVPVGNLPEGVSQKAVRKVQPHPLTFPPPCSLHGRCLNAR